MFQPKKFSAFEVSCLVSIYYRWHVSPQSWSSMSNDVRMRICCRSYLCVSSLSGSHHGAHARLNAEGNFTRCRIKPSRSWQRGVDHSFPTPNASELVIFQGFTELHMFFLSSKYLCHCWLLKLTSITYTFCGHIPYLDWSKRHYLMSLSSSNPFKWIIVVAV